MSSEGKVREYKWISLTPRFTRNDFAGYNQKDGSHIYCDAGETYYFVPESEYLALQEKCAALEAELVRSKGYQDDLTSRCILLERDSFQRAYITVLNQNEILRAALEKAIKLAEEMKDAGYWIGAPDSWTEALAKAKATDKKGESDEPE